MKILIKALAILLLLPGFGDRLQAADYGLHNTGNSPEDTANGVIRTEPAKPQQGEKFTLYYSPAGERQAATMDLYALLWQEAGTPRFAKYPMTQNNGVWSVSIGLEKKCVAMQYKFVADSFEDDNEGLFRDQMIYGTDGELVPGSRRAVGRSWIYRKLIPATITNAEMIRPVDAVRASDLFLEEYMKNPGSTEAAYHYIQGLRYKIDVADDRRAVIAETLEFATKIYEENREDPYAMAAYAFAQQQLSSRVTGTEVARELLMKYPGHPAAEAFAAWEVTYPSGGAAAPDRIEAALRFITDYPESEFPVIVDVLIPSWASIDKFMEAREWLDNYHGSTSVMYELLARFMIEKGQPPSGAVKCIDKAVELRKKDNNGLKPAYLTEREWQEEPYKSRAFNNELGLYITWSKALQASGQFSEALAPAVHTMQMTGGKDIAVVKNYISILVDAGKPAEALDAGQQIILKGIWDDELIEALKVPWDVTRGNNADFSAMIDKLHIDALKAIYREEMTDLPSNDFTLECHGCDSVTFSDLKGKIVVIDFWATWCGPCLKGLPYFQEVVNLYKDNPDVVFFGLNTLENIPAAQLRKQVDDFLKETGYTFRVIYDYRRNAVAAGYGINAIPTRLTFGPDGKLRFRELGFKGPEMTLHMRAQIEILIEDHQK